MHLTAQTFTGIGQEHDLVVGLGGQVRARLVEVFVHPGRGAVAQRDDAILPALEYFPRTFGPFF